MAATTDTPVHLRVRLTIEHAAQLLDMTDRRLRDLISWHTPHAGTITLAPGQAPIPVHRSAENGWAYVWRRDIDLAATRSAGQPPAASPSPGLAGNPTPDLAGPQEQHETPAELAGTTPGSHQRKDIP